MAAPSFMVRTMFLRRALKYYQQPFANVLFCSKVGIIRNDFIFVDFIEVLTPANHSQLYIIHFVSDSPEFTHDKIHKKKFIPIVIVEINHHILVRVEINHILVEDNHQIEVKL